MPAADNLKFMKQVLKIQKVLEQCEEHKAAHSRTNEDARYSGYFGGEAGTPDSPGGTLLSRRQDSIH